MFVYIWIYVCEYKIYVCEYKIYICEYIIYVCEYVNCPPWGESVGFCCLNKILQFEPIIQWFCIDDTYLTRIHVSKPCSCMLTGLNTDGHDLNLSIFTISYIWR